MRRESGHAVSSPRAHSVSCTCHGLCCALGSMQLLPSPLGPPAPREPLVCMPPPCGPCMHGIGSPLSPCCYLYYPRGEPGAMARRRRCMQGKVMRGFHSSRTSTSRATPCAATCTSPSRLCANRSVPPPLPPQPRKEAHATEWHTALLPRWVSARVMFTPQRVRLWAQTDGHDQSALPHAMGAASSSPLAQVRRLPAPHRH